MINLQCLEFGQIADEVFTRVKEPLCGEQASTVGLDPAYRVVFLPTGVYEVRRVRVNTTFPLVSELRSCVKVEVDVLSSRPQ